MNLLHGMRSIKEIIEEKKKNKKGDRRIFASIDEKTIEKVFFEAIFLEIKNISKEDIQNTYFKRKTLYVSSFHPAVASEVWKKKDKLIEKINNIAGKNVVADIKVK